MKEKIKDNELHIFPENDEELKVCIFILQAENKNTDIVVIHNTIDTIDY